MADRPILFSAPMVRALLEGRKTQTRRVLRPQPIGFDWFDLKCKPRLTRGDRLYVREAWKTHAAYDDISPAEMGGDEAILYVADGAHQTWGYPAISKIGRRRAGMHMPRWASRLTLVVTDVRVQQLQEINDDDAIAEGVTMEGATAGIDVDIDGGWWPGGPRNQFRRLWDSLNAARGHGWETNPWVVAVTFTVHRQNIDAMEKAA